MQCAFGLGAELRVSGRELRVTACGRNGGRGVVVARRNGNLVQEVKERTDVEEVVRARVEQCSRGRAGTLEKVANTNRQGDDRKRQDFLANVGSVTRTLREDYPRLLDRDPDLSMFAENILLRDQFNFGGMVVQGKHSYRYFFWGLRMRQRVMYKDAMIRLQNLFYDQEDGIYVRWQLYGVRRMFGWPGTSTVTVEDGLSLYKLDERGYVCEHVVVRVVPPKPRQWAHLLSWFTYAVAAPVPACAARYKVGAPEAKKDDSCSSSVDNAGI